MNKSLLTYKIGSQKYPADEQQVEGTKHFTRLEKTYIKIRGKLLLKSQLEMDHYPARVRKERRYCPFQLLRRAINYRLVMTSGLISSQMLCSMLSTGGTAGLQHQQTFHS